MQTLADKACQRELLTRIDRVRPDNPARWGRMTAPQMVCHVSDAFRMAGGGVDVSPASGLFQRTVVKWMAIYVPLRWPPGIPTRPELDQVAGRGTTPADFAADIETLKRQLDAFAAARNVMRPPHPIFGPLSESAWLRWGFLHTDHHLRQFGA
jgi:hypothetical protein